MKYPLALILSLMLLFISGCGTNEDLSTQNKPQAGKFLQDPITQNHPSKDSSLKDQTPNKFRLLITTFDSNGTGEDINVTRYNYDNNGSVTTTTELINGYSATYDENGNILTEQRDTNHDGEVDFIGTYTYNEEGIILTKSYTKTYHNGKTTSSKTEYTYDEDGKLIKETKSISQDGTISYITTYTYHDNGNLKTKSIDHILPNGTISNRKWVYNEHNKLLGQYDDTDNDGKYDNIYLYEYDKRHFSKTEGYEYILEKETFDANGDGHPSYIIKYEFEEGQVIYREIEYYKQLDDGTYIKDKGSTTIYTYNHYTRKLDYEYSLSYNFFLFYGQYMKDITTKHRIVVAFAGYDHYVKEGFIYTKQVDRDGDEQYDQFITKKFDKNSRIIFDETVYYKYNTKAKRYDYEGDNKEISTKTYKYNAQGKLLKSTSRSLDVTTGKSNYDSDTYTYDQNGNLTEWIYSHNNKQDVVIWAYDRDSNGRIVKYMENRNGKISTQYYTYDNDGKLIKVVHHKTDGTISVKTYIYDEKGNELTYNYDENNDGIIDYSTTYVYTYDKYGNMTSKGLDTDGDGKADQQIRKFYWQSYN